MNPDAGDTPPQHDALPRRLLVTGASRGIGAAVARALLARGARLAVVGRRREALEALTGGGPEHAVLVADLAQPAEAETCVERAVDVLGGLDGFVSCAGVVEYAGLPAIDAGAIDRQLAVNLVSPLRMAQRAVGPMRSAGGGSMLFVASTLALKPAPLTAAYAASKAGLIAAVRALALELAESAIRVNALAPGVVETDMVRALRLRPGMVPPGPQAEAAHIARQLEQLRGLHPLGRLGRPEDVAESALYMLGAPFVTGTVLLVDGGLSLGSGAP